MVNGPEFNKLQRFGAALAAGGGDPRLLQTIQDADNRAMETRRQRTGLQDLGRILAGTNIPAFARNEMNPQQLQQQRNMALAELGTPGAIGILSESIETPRSRLERRKTEAQISELESKQQSRAQKRELIDSLIMQPGSFGRITQDVVSTPGVKQQIKDFKDDNKRYSALLLDPEFKEFAQAQISANNEEVKNLRDIEKEKRKLEEGLTPEAAAKLSLVNQGIKNVDQALDILTDEKGGFDNLTVQSMRGISVPFLGNTGAIPSITGESKGRRARSLLLNAINAQLRAESGAAVPESEVERAFERFAPSVLDDDETKRIKIDNLRELLKGAQGLIRAPSGARGAGQGGARDGFSGVPDDGSTGQGGARGGLGGTGMPPQLPTRVLRFDAQGNPVQ